MNDIVNYYYNLEIDNIENKHECSIIQSNDRVFILKKIKDIKKYEEVMVNITEECYKTILTKENKLYFEYNGENFTLFEIHNSSKIKKDISYKEIMHNDIDYKNVWENNINYHINKIGVGDKNIYDIYYYLGMAEEALIIFNKSKKMNEIARKCISHYRIRYPNYYLFYYDPTELVIDYISRDLAEFIKVKFFYESISAMEAMNFIKKYNLNTKEKYILVARLFYPNLFFESNEKNITKKRNEYEHFLKDFIKLIFEPNNIININWIN